MACDGGGDLREKINCNFTVEEIMDDISFN